MPPDQRNPYQNEWDDLVDAVQRLYDGTRPVRVDDLMKDTGLARGLIKSRVQHALGMEIVEHLQHVVKSEVVVQKAVELAAEDGKQIHASLIRETMSMPDPRQRGDERFGIQFFVEQIAKHWDGVREKLAAFPGYDTNTLLPNLQRERLAVADHLRRMDSNLVFVEEGGEPPPLQQAADQPTVDQPDAETGLRLSGWPEPRKGTRNARNFLWWEWRHLDEMGDAAIRDKWNLEHPDDAVNLDASDTGRGTVKKGVEAADTIRQSIPGKIKKR